MQQQPHSWSIDCTCESCVSGDTPLRVRHARVVSPKREESRSPLNRYSLCSPCAQELFPDIRPKNHPTLERSHGYYFKEQKAESEPGSASNPFDVEDEFARANHWYGTPSPSPSVRFPPHFTPSIFCEEDFPEWLEYDVIDLENDVIHLPPPMIPVDFDISGSVVFKINTKK